VLRGAAVTCAPSGRDAYGRTLAACSIDGRDLGAEIVSTGWAVADFDYAGEQLAARAAARGIWSGSFVAPAEWRRAHGAATENFWDRIRRWFGN
jgi:endonuclease YncB( thermonuclease family)